MQHTYVLSTFSLTAASLWLARSRRRELKIINGQLLSLLNNAASGSDGSVKVAMARRTATGNGGAKA